jgi:hypothetical protein
MIDSVQVDGLKRIADLVSEQLSYGMSAVLIRGQELPADEVIYLPTLQYLKPTIPYA